MAIIRTKRHKGEHDYKHFTLLAKGGLVDVWICKICGHRKEQWRDNDKKLS
jgi:rubrerythrin